MDKVFALNPEIQDILVAVGKAHFERVRQQKLVDSASLWNPCLDYTSEGLHLTDKGYGVLLSIIQPYIE